MKSFCFFTDRGEIIEHHEKDDAADTDQVCDLSARREGVLVKKDQGKDGKSCRRDQACAYPWSG